ncbi:MAG: hypothetical protein P8Y18_10420 [Candidatus Bathyarchaeota archaeon]|jgi:hypothetical protein
MSLNFRIYSFNIRDSLHLELAGDFDGSSACEVINKILEHGKSVYEIFIDTHNLKIIYPHGREIFQKELREIKKQFNNITFIGRNGHENLVN